MYQSGEVDYLVATDAIGMGLNMDVDHVAFARLDKFDGRHLRRLRAHEIAQIAGRAGRHMADGTFGTTAEADAIDPEIVEAVETHTFEPLRTLMWRNPELDFRSPAQLRRSLERWSPDPVLRRITEADDHLALVALSRDPDVVTRAVGPHAVRVLWDVCQIPDFRKVLSDAHTRLLAEVYRQITGPNGRLDTDWVAKQIARLARTDGDIDTLVGRLAHIRTWTYIAHRGDWVPDPRHWQGKARSVEDLLSDALHERLTQRFVDRRQAVLVKSLKGGGELLAAVTRSGDVVVEGQYIGRIEGFRFQPDTATHAEDARALMGAARRALKDEIAARVRRLETCAHEDVALAPDGTLLWDGVAVARIAAGSDILAPSARPLPADLLEPPQRDRIAQRLAAWLAETVAETLRPLFRLRAAELSGPARGLAFQLAEGLGTLRRADVADMVATLDKPDRKRLGQLGVEIGGTYIFLPRLTKPRQVAMRALLWATANARELPPPLPAAGSLTAHADTRWPAAFYQAIGYPQAGARAARVDRLEALAAACAKLGRQGPFVPTPKLSHLAGCPMADLPGLLEAIGYRGDAGADGIVTYQRRPDRRPRDRRRPPKPSDSPFAKLQALSARR
jgi:ATP-dependent RNA helicase SUPV3L1/SUV3